MKIIEAANNSLFNFLFVLLLSRSFSPTEFTNWVLNQGFIFLFVGILFSGIYFRSLASDLHQKVMERGFLGLMLILTIFIATFYAIVTDAQTFTPVDVLIIGVYAAHEYLRRYILSFWSTRLWILNIGATFIVLILIYLNDPTINPMIIIAPYWAIFVVLVLWRIGGVSCDFKLTAYIIIKCKSFILTSVLLLISARSFFILGDLLSVDMKTLLVCLSLIGVINPIVTYIDTVKYPNLLKNGADLKTTNRVALALVSMIVLIWAGLLLLFGEQIQKLYQIEPNIYFPVFLMICAFSAILGFLNRVFFWTFSSQGMGHFYDKMGKQQIIPTLLINAMILAGTQFQLTFALGFLGFNLTQTMILARNLKRTGSAHETNDL